VRYPSSGLGMSSTARPILGCMPSQTEAVLQFMASPRMDRGVVFVPCLDCGTIVDLATAPVDVHLCAACTAEAAGLSRS
jgi:hypothetical protein